MLKRLFSFFKKNKKPARSSEEIMNIFRKKYTNFKALLESNSDLLKVISDMEDKLTGQHVFGMSYIRSQTARIVFHAVKMVKSFEELSGRRYQNLLDVLNHINTQIKQELEYKNIPKVVEYVLPYTQITKEMVDFTGGKNANLGEMKSRISLPIPKGFAITTAAFNEFIESNHLMDEIRKQKMEHNPSESACLITLSENIQKLFMTAKVPKSIEEPILSAYKEFIDEKGASRGSVKVSLRSSAIGEDSELSFAGQYLSVLNVPSDKIIRDYKQILASLFTPRAISYRLHMGIPFEDAAMSVACLEMIRSKASGVMYSRHPFNIMENNIIINAVWGLGTYAVDGVISPDAYTLSKDDSPVLLESKISHKPMQMVTRPDGYVMEIPVALEMQNLPCLTNEQALTLARYAILLEEHFKTPQDVEWALDDKDNLIILQTRPLRLEGQNQEGIAATEPLQGYTLLLEGGSVACPGVGFGPAHLVRGEDDLMSFPDGGILVAAHSSPRYVIVMQKAQAIVTNSGSVTGHMASLTREFRVPALLNTQTATTTIQHGALITVDAYSGRVYQGKVPELLEIKMEKGSFMKDTPVFQALKKVAELIVPLHLINPKSPDFTPANCKTVHDIMRFLHELSYAEVFQISDIGTDQGRISVKLNVTLPIDLYIIDLGGGLDNSTKHGFKVNKEQVTSAPFKSLLDGMLHQDLKHHAPRPINLGGFFSVMSEQMFSPQGSERFGDKSYAIISDKYLNFSSRVGYHYSVLDAYCGQTSTKNYINFQFKGGAADEVRRNRRVRLIEKILETVGFLVEIQADRVTARFAKNEFEVISQKLDILGRLLIYTRQMDMLMHNEATVTYLAECFLKGDYCFDMQHLPDR